MDIQWDRPLRHRRGGKRRLGGLDVYYDFDWRQVFTHNRSVFPKGQSLSELVARECPDGKIPTLLLTVRDDVEPGIRTIDDRYVVIVPIREYLAQAGADAASTYYARISGTPLTQLGNITASMFTEAELGRFLQEHLDQDALAEWAAADPLNQAALDSVASTRADPHDLAVVLAGLTALDEEKIQAIALRVTDIEGRDGARNLITAVTESQAGREVTAGVLASRLEERITDVRASLSRYNELIEEDGVNETAVQNLLEQHPWIVGLGYTRVKARVEIPRGEVDFILERYDGFFDVLELKGPEEPIIVESREGEDRPPSASAFSLGPALARALAQAHLYRSNIERMGELAEQYGLPDTRQPRVTILVGRAGDLTETGVEILRQINLSLHRVEVLPYDLLGRRSEVWLGNVESWLEEENTT